MYLQKPTTQNNAGHFQDFGIINQIKQKLQAYTESEERIDASD